MILQPVAFVLQQLVLQRDNYPYNISFVWRHTNVTLKSKLVGVLLDLQAKQASSHSP